jgi:hypothetical protein
MDEEGMPQWLDAADEHYYSMEVDDEYQKLLNGEPSLWDDFM